MPGIFSLEPYEYAMPTGARQIRRLDRAGSATHAALLITALVLSNSYHLTASAATAAHSPPGESPAPAPIHSKTTRRGPVLRDVAARKQALELAKRNDELIAQQEKLATRAEATINRVNLDLTQWESQLRKADSTGAPPRTTLQSSWDWRAAGTVCISLVALLFSVGTYRRKAGMQVRGSFALSSATACNDRYVSRIILENLKDRAITVFAVYLRVGYNYYITVEDFQDEPLLLKAYESYHEEYGPIEFYGASSNRVSMNSLLENPKVPKKLVLSTADGRYLVPTRIRHWEPIVDWFRNRMTATLRPVRTTYKGIDLGANIKYVIEFIGANGQSEICPIHPEDYRLVRFRDFQLTRESLDSATALTAFLDEQLKCGKLNGKTFTVHDLADHRQRAHEFYSGRRVEARYYGFLKYHLLGRLGTWLADRELKKQNEQRKNA